jgi:uncharacterized protein (DUF362 family)
VTLPPHLVAVVETGQGTYPPAPFSPSICYPEYEGTEVCPVANPVYSGVRELFFSLGLDRANFGTPRWNPLGGMIRPGDRVLIKPNLVRHYHPYGFDCRSIVTHASILRAVCDFAFKAGGPRTRLVIADAPLQSCDFAEAVKLSGIDRLVSYYRRVGAEVEVRDLRLVRTVVEKSSLYGKVLVQAENAGDPRGYTGLDLGRASAHAETGTDSSRYRVTCYDPARMARYHGGGRHEYVIANTLLEADVVINVPKLKTHQKAGLTAALKNFVGINGHKDCLPHHTKGSREDGGDEYATGSWAKRTDSWLQDAKEQTDSRAARKAAAVAHRVLESVHKREGYWAGSWYGNRTIARTTIDLNRIVRYARQDGMLADHPQRTVFSIVDGIVAGDEDGPLAPSPRPVGVLMAGIDPVAVDVAAARLMGFRYRSVPTVQLALDGASGFRLAEFNESSLELVSASPRWNRLAVTEPGDSLHFRPHQGWKGHLEL